MRMKHLALFAIAVWMAPGVAAADVLSLSNGGVLKGTAQEVTFSTEGKARRYGRDKLVKLSVLGSGRDVLELAGGVSLTGTFGSLQFRSVGGLLTFGRGQVAMLQVDGASAAQIRAKLKARRAKLKDGDAQGLLELALWCQANGLKAELAELARACLKARPKVECADRAHRLLGHVRYQGHWMTRAERMKLQQAQVPVPPDTPPPPDPVAPVKLTPGEQKQALAKNDELYRAYIGRAEARKKEQLDAIEEKYHEEWTAKSKEFKKAAFELKWAQKTWEDARARFRRDLENRAMSREAVQEQLDQRYNVDEHNRDIAARRDHALQKKGEVAQLAAQIKPLTNKAQRIESARKERLRQVQQKVRRIFTHGGSLSREKMLALYDEAFGED